MQALPGRETDFQPRTGLLPYLKLLRPLQWVKNLLIFLPPLLAHELRNLLLYRTLLLAFGALSLCASAAYILNDICDLESDRRHPVKKDRPLAGGQISLAIGWMMALALVAISVLLGFLLVSRDFTFLLLLYFMLSLSYSLCIKRIPLLDVLSLSGLYALRIFMGGVAVSVPISQWLLAFSLFFFLGIAFVKRYVELQDSKAIGAIPGRNYQAEDVQVVQISGIASAYMSVVIFFLYIANSREAATLYRHPQWLWVIGPLLLYWHTRLWMLGMHRRINSDPLVFVIKDPGSWIVGLFAAACVVLASI